MLLHLFFQVRVRARARVVRVRAQLDAAQPLLPGEG
jgi:hypothetical protein